MVTTDADILLAIIRAAGGDWLTRDDIKQAFQERVGRGAHQRQFGALEGLAVGDHPEIEIRQARTRKGPGRLEYRSKS